MSTTHLSSSKSTGVDVDMLDGQEDLLKLGWVFLAAISLARGRAVLHPRHQPCEATPEKRAVPDSPRSADEKRSTPPLPDGTRHRVTLPGAPSPRPDHRRMYERTTDG